MVSIQLCRSGTPIAQNQRHRHKLREDGVTQRSVPVTSLIFAICWWLFSHLWSRWQQPQTNQCLIWPRIHDTRMSNYKSASGSPRGWTRFLKTMGKQRGSKIRCVIHGIRGGTLRWKGNTYLVILVSWILGFIQLTFVYEYWSGLCQLGVDQAHWGPYTLARN